MLHEVPLNEKDYRSIVEFLTTKGYVADVGSVSESQVTVSVDPNDADTQHFLQNLLSVRQPQSTLRFSRQHWIELGGFSGRDYLALIGLLLNLARLPDVIGRTDLTHEEASQIRSFGFPAAAGPWLVPPLPWRLVAGFGLLERLSDVWVEQHDPRRQLLPEHRVQHAKRSNVDPSTDVLEITLMQGIEAVSQRRAHEDWTKDEQRVVRTLDKHGGWLRKRRLQQKLWKIPGERLNRALQSLVDLGVIQWDRRVVRLLLPISQRPNKVDLPRRSRAIERIVSVFQSDHSGSSYDGSSVSDR